ncbi:MAG: hypothetical protein V1770_06795 [bacterium]
MNNIVKRLAWIRWGLKRWWYNLRIHWSYCFGCHGKFVMICSECGNVIAHTDAEDGFDIYDMAWTCPHCKKIWYSSSGWEIIGVLFVPFEKQEGKSLLE